MLRLHFSDAQPESNDSLAATIDAGRKYLRLVEELGNTDERVISAHTQMNLNAKHLTPEQYALAVAAVWGDPDKSSTSVTESEQ